MSTSALVRSRRAQERVSWPARARSRAQLLAAVVLLFAVAVTLGWVFHVEPLVSPGATRAGTKLNVALAIACLAGTFFVADVRVRRLLRVVPLLYGVAVLVEYALDVDLHIDQLLVSDWTDALVPGRPAGATAGCLVLLAVAGQLNELGRPVAAQLLSTLPLTVGTLALYGHLYGVESFQAFRAYSTMTPLASIAVMLLSGATLMVAPKGVVQWMSFGKDPGAALQRLLIPAGVVVLPLGGWLTVQGYRRGLYSSGFGTALLVAFCAVVVVVLAIISGRLALRIDDQREALLEQLGEVNHELEDRVRVRSHQLNRQRTKLVLLEERDRIARDLHDRVIQRIFAAGLQVGGVARTQRKLATRDGADPAVADGLDAIAIELDLAIRELRNSIFQLTSIADHDDVEQVVRDIVSRASRILGFMPRVDVTGQIAGLDADLVAQVASVIQEALSNVARHARADAAQVSVWADHEVLRLTIADDGVGLPDPLPRSSGISNLLDRARQLGGTASWGANDPKGTVVVWEVPREGGARDDYGNDTPVARSDSSHSAVPSAGS